MNPKNTWAWFIVAAGLFAAILFYQNHAHKTSRGPSKVLPGLKASAVASVQVRPAAGRAIQAERTNDVWRLTDPRPYPAQKESIEGLLNALEALTPATVISARELRSQPNPDEEYGFVTPQATITLQQPDYHVLVEIGARTAPGDQVFVRVVGDIFVVDAGILKHLPATADDWRDTTLIDLNGLAFDRLSITNGTKIVQLARGGTNEPWRMTYPLSARADNRKIYDGLRKLGSLSVQQFVPDDVKVDLDAFGLQPPELELAFGLGTNPPTVLQFGKSPTNDSRLVYARRFGESVVVTVASDLLNPWRDRVNDFRDPYVLDLKAPPALVEVRGGDNFMLEQQTNGTWRVLPQGLLADPNAVKDMLSSLNMLRIIEFIDVVIEPDLPGYGLASPCVGYTLMSAPTNLRAGATNAIVADVSFGTNKAGKVFARRADESFVYGISSNDFHRLGWASWQMRDRTIWNLSTNDISGVSIRDRGKVRQMRRNGPYSWSLITKGAPPNDLAVEETVRGLCQLSAAAWTARGGQDRASYGFTTNGFQVTLELKNGEKKTVEFGGPAPSGRAYAAVDLDGAPWIFEFPLDLSRDVASYLTIPADVP